ncbi:hypothetical protein HAX54_048778, partial [Datura stramonium]|nr:hypothetical protein [Datura stramonium]
MAREAPPSTQEELLMAASETAPGSLPKPAPSTLSLFLEFMSLKWWISIRIL